MTLPEDYRITVGDRAEQADASPLEIHFEDSFSNAYGMNALRYLTREYGNLVMKTETIIFSIILSEHRMKNTL